jgi:hypothetical protein
MERGVAQAGVIALCIWDTSGHQGGIGVQVEGLILTFVVWRDLLNPFMVVVDNTTSRLFLSHVFLSWCLPRHSVWQNFRGRSWNWLPQSYRSRNDDNLH